MSEQDHRNATSMATRPAPITRSIAHAVTVVLALFVGGFSLLFIFSRAQEDGARPAHPLDPLIGLYDAVGGVGVFAIVSLFWVAIFGVLAELFACARTNQARGMRNAIAIEVVAFALFLGLWYLPLRIG
jgi:hypothetical protein